MFTWIADTCIELETDGCLSRTLAVGVAADASEVRNPEALAAVGSLSFWNFTDSCPKTGLDEGWQHLSCDVQKQSRDPEMEMK